MRNETKLTENKIIRFFRKLNKTLMKKYYIGFKKHYPFKTSTIFLKNKFKKKKNLIAIEIGTLRGESTEFLLKENPNIKRVYCVDPYSDDFFSGGKSVSSYFKEAKKRLSKFGDKIVFVRKTSNDAINFFKKKKIKPDFIYIDGDHSFKQTKKDMENYFKILKKGGILAGHDIQYLKNNNVCRALFEFCCKKNQIPLIKEMDWIIVKNVDKN